MGELRLNPADVRAAAHHALAVADDMAEIAWSTWDSGELAGSAVADIAAPTVAEGRIADIVAHLRDWAAAAQRSITDVERAETHTAGRLDRG